MVESTSLNNDHKPQLNNDGFAGQVNKMPLISSRSSSSISLVSMDGLFFEGHAGLTNRYDDHGNIAEQGYLRHGRQADRQLYGCAKRIMKYDDAKRVVDIDFLVLMANRCSTGTELLSAVYGYDSKGNRYLTSCFGVDGKPILNGEGYARQVVGYDAAAMSCRS